MLGDRLVQLLGSELELLKLERKIDEQVRGSLFQNQREFFLQEQLRAIHRELGQDEGDEGEELARQIAERGLPEAVAARAQRELRKLRRSSPMSPDAAVARGWLDWVLGTAVERAQRRHDRSRRTRARCWTGTTSGWRK